MKTKEKLNNNPVYNSKEVAKNSIYNIAGYLIPLVFAIILIPPLISGLGVERFGILSLSWVIIGYFSFFDFGIGRSMTKVIAEKIGINDEEKIPAIFWTSLLLMILISLIVLLVLLFFIPDLVNLFNISEELKTEATYTFFALAVAIPLVATTAGLRGVLEAYQKFKIINILRLFLGAFSFLGPLLVLYISDSIFDIIIFLIGIRLIVWTLYLLQCFKVNYNLKRIVINFRILRPLLKLSLWITIANIIGPIITYSDRFLIASLISAATVTYYVTPYEVVTKLLLIPGAIVGVLFPIFSSTYLTNFKMSKDLFIRGTKFIFLILYPIILILSTLSFEGLTLWLGSEFAQSSSIVMQFLIIGVLFNAVAFVPFNFFQGIGLPKLPALVNLIELPFYLFFMWIAIGKWGINGAAFVWLLRMIIDSFVLFYLSYKLYNFRFENSKYIYSFIFLLSGLIFPFILTSFLMKVLFLSFFVPLFLIITWFFYLTGSERELFNDKLFAFSNKSTK
jgi:O-antigen/teichoic acid export membrane protein